MTETAEHPHTSVLRRLSTLRDLSAAEVQDLATRLFIHEAAEGSVVLKRGSTEDSTLYLLDGTCLLVTNDNVSYKVRHTDSSALSPLARLRPSLYDVVAQTPVRFLRIDNSFLTQSTASFEAMSSLALESYEVEEEDDFGHMGAENQLTVALFEDINNDRVLLPSLPNVAVRIGDAVNDENSSAAKVARVIETDPAIALKIVKAANSARYGGASQVATVADAVARLGMQNTRMLVIAFALRELFRTESAKLGKRMLQLWEHSRRIAALAHVLSSKVKTRFNPNEALLAGLIHDIGSLAVIAYARDFPAVANDTDALEASIHALRSQLSGMILAKWALPDQLVSAAKDAENWFREHKGKADYADLVIVAQLHDGVAGDIDASRISALSRLGLTVDAEDGAVDALKEASSEIHDSRLLLSA